MNLPKLPIGIQTFEQIRSGGYIYIDKTAWLLKLIDSGKVYFLSRPRRFGKSLTLSTLDALFSGKQELFNGTVGAGRLYAAEFFERPDYRPSPVVHIDMSTSTTDAGTDGFRSSLFRLVQRNAETYGFSLPQSSPDVALADLLRTLAQKQGPVAVLIDEYDKPILDHLDNPEIAAEFRAVLRGFYTQIKAEDASTRFVFLTGISKFTKTGVFSAMNNLYDITLDPAYSAMLGITKNELLDNFSGHLAQIAAELNMTETQVLADIKNYYDGFSFDGKTRLYNPFSTLSFFQMKDFKNFWYDSGSPSFLMKYIARYGLAAEDFRGKMEDEGFTSVSEIELASPSSFLFQSGYLTIREKDGPRLILDYPNREVLSSMSKLFMTGKLNNRNAALTGLDLADALAKGEADAIVRYYNQTLAAIPYDIYVREEADYKKYAETDPYNNRAESFYHAVLFTLLWASGVTTLAENHSYHGRSDIEVLHKGWVYVVELKIADTATEAEKAADEALAQIYTKGYADKYASKACTSCGGSQGASGGADGGGKPARLLGMAVDRSVRKVGAARTAVLG